MHLTDIREGCIFWMHLFENVLVAPLVTLSDTRANIVPRWRRCCRLSHETPLPTFSLNSALSRRESTVSLTQWNLNARCDASSILFSSCISSLSISISFLLVLCSLFLSFSCSGSIVTISLSLFYSCFPPFRSGGKSGDRRLSCRTKGRGVKGGKARNVATPHDRATSNGVDMYIGNAAVTQHRVAALLLLMVLVRYALRWLRDIRQRQCRPFTTRFCNSILYEYPTRRRLLMVSRRDVGDTLTATCLPTESTFMEHVSKTTRTEINSNYE